MWVGVVGASVLGECGRALCIYTCALLHGVRIVLCMCFSHAEPQVMLTYVAMSLIS